MNIFVGNLNPDTNAEGLRQLFSEFGEIMTSKVIFDNATGMSRGFGFVEMSSIGASQDAIDNLDMTYFEGNIISVKEAKQNNTGGGNNRGGGFNRGGGGGFNRGGGGGNRGGGYGQQRPQQYGTSPGGRPYRPRTPRPDGDGGYNANRNENRYNSNNYNNDNRYNNNNDRYNSNNDGNFNNANAQGGFNRDRDFNKL